MEVVAAKQHTDHKLQQYFIRWVYGSIPNVGAATLVGSAQNQLGNGESKVVFVHFISQILKQV